jgi:rubredoxin
MNRHKAIKQSSLSVFIEAGDKERDNSITQDPSILTHRIKQPKSSDISVAEWKESILCMSTCSRFDSCSAMKCPMDIFINERTELEGDPRCGIAKATRHKYWESLPEDLRSRLPYEGYFQSEYARMKAAKERWNALSEDRKAEIRERMRNVRANHT